MSKNLNLGNFLTISRPNKYLEIAIFFWKTGFIQTKGHI